MSGYIAFIGKEIKEQLRTFKVFVWLTVMVLFGIMSPVLAKLMPDILASMGISVDLGGEAPYLSAYAQFFKNVGQMGFIVLLVMFSGVVASEKSKGTATLMLTKKLSRSAFILSKYTAMTLLWTVGYILAALIHIYYTMYLFPEGNLRGVFPALLSLWLFGELLLAITLLASVLFNNLYLGMLGAFIGWGMLLVTDFIPKVSKQTPLLLSTHNYALVQMDLSLGQWWRAYWQPAVYACGLVLLLVFAAIQVLKRQEL